LNPIEEVWREVKGRLQDTEPTSRETRAKFICRLQHTVAWVWRNRNDALHYRRDRNGPLWSSEGPSAREKKDES